MPLRPISQSEFFRFPINPAAVNAAHQPSIAEDILTARRQFAAPLAPLASFPISERLNAIQQLLKGLIILLVVIFQRASLIVKDAELDDTFLQ